MINSWLKLFAVSLLAAGLAVASPVPVAAQDAAGTSTAAATNDDDDDGEEGLWGLAGLLGLIGLAGLRRRRDRHDHVTPAHTTTVRP